MRLDLVILLAAPHRGEPGSIPGRFTQIFSQVGIVPGEAAGRVFSRGSLVPPCLFIPAPLHTHIASPTSALLPRSLTKAPGENRLVQPQGQVRSQEMEACRPGARRFLRQSCLRGSPARDWRLPSLYGLAARSRRRTVGVVSDRLTNYKPDRKPVPVDVGDNCRLSGRFACLRPGTRPQGMRTPLEFPAGSVCKPGCGSEVVRLLALHHGEPGSIPGGVAPGFLLVGIVLDGSVGRRVFSGISRPPSCVAALPHTNHASPSSAPNTPIACFVTTANTTRVMCSTGFSPRPGHSRNFAYGNREGRCIWSAGFLCYLPFPPPLNSGVVPFILTSFRTHRLIRPRITAKAGSGLLDMCFFRRSHVEKEPAPKEISEIDPNRIICWKTFPVHERKADNTAAYQGTAYKPSYNLTLNNTHALPGIRTRTLDLGGGVTTDCATHLKDVVATACMRILGVGWAPVGTPRLRSKSEGAIGATITRIPCASSLLRAWRAVFPSYRCTVQIRRETVGRCSDYGGVLIYFRLSLILSNFERPTGGIITLYRSVVAYEKTTSKAADVGVEVRTMGLVVLSLAGCRSGGWNKDGREPPLSQTYILPSPASISFPPPPLALFPKQLGWPGEVAWLLLPAPATGGHTTVVKSDETRRVEYQPIRALTPASSVEDFARATNIGFDARRQPGWIRAGLQFDSRRQFPTVINELRSICASEVMAPYMFAELPNIVYVFGEEHGFAAKESRIYAVLSRKVAAE
ncbi:hypothetical protein PR048_017406 [Dryococelus australis]|uniref:Uncharacterized protein n=1 Tax=Dryococelus australis TaxID=614101 RepID=A0ABQ9H9E9_9NEOP|nr:hypothetical protein PR048_017406 [Dryococelus australis]